MIILILRSQMRSDARSVDRLFMIMSRDVIQAAMRVAAAATRACGDWRVLAARRRRDGNFERGYWTGKDFHA